MKANQMSKLVSAITEEFDPLLIEKVNEIIKKNDIDMDYLISEFLHKIYRDEKIPFKLKQPNAKFRKYLEDIKAGKGEFFSAGSLEELMTNLKTPTKLVKVK